MQSGESSVTAYGWACEVDRELKLGLSNGQVELLARMLHPDPEAEARKILAGGVNAALKRLGLPSRRSAA